MYCTIYLKRTKQRYAERGMERESATSINIYDWKEYKILLSYPDKCGTWNISHTGYKKVT